MPPPGWHAIQPEGLSASILGVSIAFSIMCTVVITLRVIARLKMKMFTLEDTLMCIGYVINMVHNSVIAYGTFSGVGSSDARVGLGSPMYVEAIKSIFLWQVFFLSGFVFIKCSICLTLLRIAIIKWHRITLWILIAITVVSTIFVDVYILIQCRPIPTLWGGAEGTCLPSSITVAITFVISALNLVTDVTTAVLPFLMLRQVQMTRSKKQAVVAILSLGVLASIATIARLPFAQAYYATSDYLVGIGDIILWTVVECDLALIAGSLPMLRTLFKGLYKGSTGDKYVHSTELNTVGNRTQTRKGYLRQDDDAIDHKSESMRNIVVKQDRVIVHEDRDSDGHNDFEPTYKARTYV
ncbi:hypothetical protein BX600DRAFT_468437 [Xylariales sp. PMI_506]|nr:hypothetical protein BX600DRAFT_468437 [Xylariales sp. PMI_506]